MANTLTSLVPDVYEALDVVSRELAGFIPASTIDAQAARAAVGQPVVVPIAPPAPAEDVVPGTYPPDTGDQSFENTQITITKSRGVPFRWTGEGQRGVNSGPGYMSLRADQIAQAIRTLVNEIESDAAALYTKCSRAYGTAGTTPFASDLSDFAQIYKILVDNGCPRSDLQMVINTTAGANIRGNTQFTNVNQSGDVSLRRQGVLVPTTGMDIRESARIVDHSKGTGSGYLVNNASGYSAGATSVAVDTGTGTVLAGDVLTFAGDSNKYISDAALSGGLLDLSKPGLRDALADNAAVTVGGNYAANMAFHRSAIVLAARAPALPEEGDMAIDRMNITDPRTGLTFELAMYAQYRRVRYEIALAWGWANIKPEHTAILLG